MHRLLGTIHDRFIHQRRVQILTNHFSDLINANATVLDIGCGDGQLAKKLTEKRPDISIEGLDVLVRPHTAIPVSHFDGETVPFDNGQFDTVMMVDVLHHTIHPSRLLSEAARVAKEQVVIKDHYLQGPLARHTLRLMDYVGNARHGVAIPCNYLSKQRWDEIYGVAGLKAERVIPRLGLYRAPLNCIFERGLHFIANLVDSEADFGRGDGS